MQRHIYGVGLGLAAMLGVSTSAISADLALSVNGVRNDKGNIMIAVFDKAATFRKSDAAVAAIRMRARRGVMKLTLPGLPSGTYAVSVFHDENGDRKLESNMLGVPTEGYGFSNDARGVMGPPSFEDAAVTAGNGIKSVPIKLGY